MAKANTDDFPGIAASTFGMVFMGTPHRGTGKSLHSQGQIYQAIVSAKLHAEDSILKTLEEGNETLVDVVREFTRLVNVPSSKVKIFCFFEQRPTVVGAIVKDSSIQVCTHVPSLPDPDPVLMNCRNSSSMRNPDPYMGILTRV